MINSLTPGQESLLSVYRDKWLKIGLSTDPCDRTKAEAAAIAAYSTAGLKPPAKVVWCDSPLSLVLTDATILASVGDSVGASVRASVGDSVGDSVWDSAYGSQDAHWLGFYDFFLEAMNLDCAQKLKPLMSLALDCGWWIPRENICLLSEKPTRCLLQDGVIHAEDGPAIAYKDGFSAWAINGVRVDEQVVMRPEAQTLDQINNEDNEEVKRIRIERYGWTKYLAESNAKVLDTKVVQLNSGTTWMESLMTLDDLSVLCTYDPSTGRPYALEVDPDCKTCEQAQRYLQAPDEAFSGFTFRPVETYPVLRT